MQAFRGNFFAETGTENALKRKRTANANLGARSRLTSTSTRLNRRGKIFDFFRFWGVAGTPGVQGRLDAPQNRAIMKG